METETEPTVHFDHSGSLLRFRTEQGWVEVSLDELLAEQEQFRQAIRRWCGDLIAQGVPGDVLGQQLADVPSAPDAAEISSDPLSSVLRRYGWLTYMLEEQCRFLAGYSWMGDDEPTLLSMDEPDPEAFFKACANGRPVLGRGWVTHWPAVGKWTPEYLNDEFGSCLVEVMADRDLDPLHERRYDEHRQHMPLSEFIAATMMDGQSTNDLYIHAQNNLFGQEGMFPLFSDIDVGIDGITCDRYGMVGYSQPFVGGAGATTQLHIDRWNVLLCQAMGRKRVMLAPPWCGRQVGGGAGDVSFLDPLDGAPEEIDAVQAALAADLVLEAGDALLIPAGWWHWARCLTPCATLSLTKFSDERGNRRIERHRSAWTGPRPG